MTTLEIAGQTPVSAPPSSAPTLPLENLRWTWQADEAPIKIRLSLDVVSRLRRDIETEQSAGKTQIGGVLFGRKVPGSIEIQDYESVRSSADTEGEYRLDMTALEPLKEARPNLLILGYYRAQVEGALNLRLDEIDFVSEHFHDSSNVVLLIRPSSKQFTAGFLFWEGDTLIPFSVHDFPFEIESLRSSALPQRVMIPAVPMPSAAPLARVDLEQDIGHALIKVPIRQPAAQGKQRPKSFIRRTLIALSSLTLAGGISGIVMLDRLLPAPRIEAPTVVASVPIELRAEAQEGGLDIRWNSQSGPVGSAREGRLMLSGPDGRVANISLDRQQLSSGALHMEEWFAPVDIRMEVADSRGRTDRELLSLSVPSAPTVEPEPPAPLPVAKLAVTKKKPSPWKPAVPARPAASQTKPAPSPAPAVVPAAYKTAGEGSEPQDFDGAWTYSSAQGRYDGAEPEVVDGVIHEENGRLNGTMFVHFKRNAGGAPDLTHKFEFTGQLQRGSAQIFPLNGSPAQGTIELVAGNSPGLLEVHFNGTEHSGRMVLVKK